MSGQFDLNATQGESTPVSLEDLLGLDSLASVPSSVLSCLLEACDFRNIEADETLYTIGQYDAFECFAVVQGSLKLTHVSPSTGDMSIEIVKAGDIIGLDLVLANKRDVSLSIGVEAQEETLLISIESDALLDTFSKSTEALQSLLAYCAGRMIAHSLGKSKDHAADERVFKALFQRVERDPSDATSYIIAEMPKHRELAEIAGVTDVEAAEAVALLLRQGIAKRDYPGLIIEDYDALQKLSA